MPSVTNSSLVSQLYTSKQPSSAYRTLPTGGFQQEPSSPPQALLSENDTVEISNQAKALNENQQAGGSETEQELGLPTSEAQDVSLLSTNSSDNAEGDPDGAVPGPIILDLPDDP